MPADVLPARPFGRPVFAHHGRAILRDPAGELAKAREILGPCVQLADDGMTTTR